MEARTTLTLTVWLLLQWKNGLYGYGEVIPVTEGPVIGVATCAGLAACGDPSTTSLITSFGRVKYELVASGKKSPISELLTKPKSCFIQLGHRQKRESAFSSRFMNRVVCAIYPTLFFSEKVGLACDTRTLA